MSDFLITFNKHPLGKRISRMVGLPRPRMLSRIHHPFDKEDLSGSPVTLMTIADSALHSPLRWLLKTAAYSVNTSEEITERIVFDATSLSKVEQLGCLYDFFSVCLKSLPANSRIVLISRAPQPAHDPERRALCRGLEGFTRSVAKEAGSKGATANLIYLHDGGEPWLAGPLRFLLSPRSAFISGQPWSVSGHPDAQALPGEILEQPLRGKTALITGAAQGLGAATALRLAEEGATVIGVDLPANTKALDVVSSLTGGESLPLDIADNTATDKLLHFLRHALSSQHSNGPVDIVIHNAGTLRDKTIAKMTRAEWENSIKVNLSAIIRLDKSLIGNNLLADHGRLIYLSSIAGIAGNVGQTNYALCKAAMIGYAAAQAQRLAPRGITANAVAPGLIETPMMKSMPWLFREMARRMNSLKQAGTPRDVAELVTFLCTPGAAGISGQTLRVCGQNLIGA